MLKRLGLEQLLAASFGLVLLTATAAGMMAIRGQVAVQQSSAVAAKEAHHALLAQKLAMLQTPNFFYSPDPFERNLLQYKTIPNEGELFYGIIQDGNDLWNATFFCGSCARSCCCCSWAAFRAAFFC